jgi:group I intron endonuclease
MNGIYKIENLINHKVYIGQSKNIEVRWKEGLTPGHMRSYNSHLLNSIKKYGIENFSKEVILETWDMDYWEKFFIQMYRSNDPKYGYNKTIGGQNAGYDFYSDEVKDKIRQKAIGRKLSEETKQKLSILSKGENNARFGIRGELHPCYGQHRTDEEKRIISEKVKQAWTNKTEEEILEWKSNMSKNHADVSGENHPLYGIGHTEKSRKKMSDSRKAYWQNLSEEEKEKISNSCKERTSGAKNGRAKKVRCIETGEVFDYILAVKEKYPKAYSKISMTCNGLRDTAGGLHWEWA